MSETIVLIKPHNPNFSVHLPFGLLFVGNALKNAGYDVKIFDTAINHDWKERLEDYLTKGILWLGISGFTPDVKMGIDICAFSKEKSKDTPIVWGGIHAMLLPQQTLEHKNVDYVVSGEGDYSSVELSSALKGELPFSEVQGLCYHDNGVYHSNKYNGFVNLEELPELDYDLAGARQYLCDEHRCLPYQSSRGCPSLCTFCYIPITNNLRYRTKSAEKVMYETERLAAKYKLESIEYIDDNFFTLRRRVREFAERKKASGSTYKFNLECRADYFKEGFVDKQMISNLVEVGMNTIQIGAESGSPAMLKKVKKGITVENLNHSIEILKDFPQLQTSYGFIIGLPGETIDDVMQTVKLYRKMTKVLRGHVATAITTFTPYPGGELTQELLDSGQLQETKRLEDWTTPEVLDLYAGRFDKKPWHIKSPFICNVSNYSLYSSNYWSDRRIKETILNPRLFIIEFPLLALIVCSRIRFAIQFFDCPIDIWAYKKSKTVWPKVLSVFVAAKRMLRRFTGTVREQDQQC